MIKLIATDLDGTLFYPKRRIRLLIKKNIHFLQDYINDGNHVVLVTGRNFHIIHRIMKKVKTKLDMIACNGSVVYKDNCIKVENPMNHEEVKKMYEENLNNKDIISWIFMTDKNNMIVVPNRMNYLVTFVYRIGMVLQLKYRGNYKFGKRHLKKMFENEDEKIYKAMCIFGLGKKGIRKASLEMPKMLEKYGDKFEICQSHESLELMNKGVNKASCLLEYIKEMDLNINEVAVVGDSGNDIPLFEVFPNSYVMNQADPSVKAKANTVIDGVYALKEHI